MKRKFGRDASASHPIAGHGRCLYTTDGMSIKESALHIADYRLKTKTKED